MSCKERAVLCVCVFLMTLGDAHLMLFNQTCSLCFNDFSNIGEFQEGPEKVQSNTAAPRTLAEFQRFSAGNMILNLHD